MSKDPLDPGRETPAPEPTPGLRYRTETAIEGDPLEATARVVRSLANAGFRLEEQAGTWARLTGPGLRSTNQQPILGATAIEVRSGFGRLEVDADLGGVQWLSRFARWFPITLVTVLTLPVLALAVAGVLPRAAIVAPAIVLVVQLLIWSIVGPWMARRIRQRTEAAIDTLVNNAALGV